MVTQKPLSQLALLTDEQMRHYFAHGYLVLKANVPREVNQAIRQGIDVGMDRLGDMGNNVLPQIPALQQIFKDPVIRGALTSVLGPGYVMHSHRYAHRNNPGAPGGAWHKDSYWGYTRKVRNQRPWWAMVMYYPQDVKLENGPTAVMPGRQHYLLQYEKEPRNVTRATGEAGTFILVHYDQWHQASPNGSDLKRFMLKFQFLRTEAPTAPAWQSDSGNWIDPRGELPPTPHRTAWRHLWNWSSGRKANQWHTPAASGSPAAAIDALKNSDPAQRAAAADQLGMLGPAASDAVDALAALLRDADESVVINAAYALAAIGAPAMPALIAALRDEKDLARRHAAYGLGAVGPEAMNALLATSGGLAAYALGEIGVTNDAVISFLQREANSSDPVARIAAADSLGMLGRGAASATSTLVDLMQHDVDSEVRFTAARALMRLGPAAADATDALIESLDDNNRYVRGYAVDALQRIGTPEAINALLDHLKASRWCPVSLLVHPYTP